MYCFDKMVEKSIAVHFKLGLIPKIPTHPTLDFYITAGILYSKVVGINAYETSTCWWC